MIRRYTEHPLAQLNSFHVEEVAAHIIEFDHADDLMEIFAPEKAPQKWLVLGGGNNILFTQRSTAHLFIPRARN